MHTLAPQFICLPAECSAGWIITEQPGLECSATFLLSGVSHSTAYRAELEGVYRLLQSVEYLDKNPDEIRIWCDNQEAIRSSTEKPTRRDVMRSDADLVLAIHKVKERFKSVSFRHVYSHQDTAKGRKRAQKADETKMNKVETGMKPQ